MTERISPSLEKISIRLFNDFFKNGEINLDPSYQRNNVWPEDY